MGFGLDVKLQGVIRLVSLLKIFLDIYQSFITSFFINFIFSSHRMVIADMSRSIHASVIRHSTRRILCDVAQFLANFCRGASLGKKY